MQCVLIGLNVANGVNHHKHIFDHDICTRRGFRFMFLNMGHHVTSAWLVYVT